MAEVMNGGVERLPQSASHAAWALDRAIRQISARQDAIAILRNPAIQPAEQKEPN